MNEPVELPAALADRYRVERPLSQGAFGWVLECTQLKLNRRVALKLLHAERQAVEATVKRFLAEARLTASLIHPNIVQVLDHGVDDAVPWIAYELLPGGTLAERIDRGPLPVGQALAVGAQLCAAVELAHRAGVLHRDIKSANVLQAADGAYKLTDFGLAKWSGEHTILTAEGAMVGTPGYMAPELATGIEASVGSDVYALGILVFEMLTGARPFTGTSGLEVLQKHIKAPPPAPSARLPGIPPEVDRAVLGSLAKAPADRPASAGAFGAALEALIPGRSGPTSTPGRPRSRPSRQERTLSVAVAAPTPPGRQLGLAIGVAVITCAAVIGVGIKVLEPAPAPASAPPSASAAAPSPSPSVTSAPDTPVSPSPAASLAPALSDALRHHIASTLDAQNARRRTLKFSFGELVEKTADNTSFLGLSPEELAEQIRVAHFQREMHLALRDDAATVVALVQRELPTLESTRTEDLLALANILAAHAVESIEVLRYDRLVVVLDHLSQRQAAKNDRLEDTLQELKTICYPSEVQTLLDRHAELTGIVLARMAATDAPDPAYPQVLDQVWEFAYYFTSYTICGVKPLEVVLQTEKRSLARIEAVRTPAGQALARLVPAIWRSRVGSTAGYGRSRAEVHEILRRLRVIHPPAAAALERLEHQIPR